MFLKQQPFEFNGQSLTLNELSALQRIHYLDYLAAEEKALADLGDGLSEQEMTTRLIGMSIRSGARLIAFSLWHNDPKGPSEEDLHHSVLSTWPAEAIGKAEMQVKLLSGMLLPVKDDAADPDAPAEDESAEPVTAEKPLPAS